MGQYRAVSRLPLDRDLVGMSKSRFHPPFHSFPVTFSSSPGTYTMRYGYDPEYVRKQRCATGGMESNR